MTSDPVFGRSSLGNVDRQHQLSRIVEGIDQCSEDARESTDPCDFTTCGAGGLCRPVTPPSSSVSAPNGAVADLVVAGCACVPGATARATFAPDGSPTVICQDGRMSFLNAGDRETDDAPVLPDACAGYDCGEHGQCTAMNLTPTCVCDQGFVALAQVDSGGGRRVTCTEPDDVVPAAFYDKRLPVLPSDLPGGRNVGVAEVQPAVTPPAITPVVEPPSFGFPMPRGNPDYPPASTTPSASDGSASGGNCNVAGANGAARVPSLPWVVPLLIAAARFRRSRARR
jgi:hypothetical protein